MNLVCESLDEYFNVSKLDDIPIDIPISNLRSKILKDIKIEKGSVTILDPDFLPYVKYDFVINSEGELYIGSGHYKLSKKAPNIKGAGEIMFDDAGKIIYLNNESGHYKPSPKNLYDIAQIFKESDLFNTEYSVIHKKYDK